MDNQIRIGKNQSIMAKVIPGAEAIEYQEDSVVSKTLLNKAGGTITLFAFDAGQGLSEHTAPFDAVVNLLDGEAEITIAGNPLYLKTGDLIVMPANEPHALQANHRFKMMLIMIKS